MLVFIEDSAQKIKSKGSLCSFGTLWVTTEDFYVLEKSILELRLKYHCWGEIRWQNIDKNHIELYKKVIELFSSLERVKFNSIITKVPSSANLKLFHTGDKTTYGMKLIWMVIAYNYFGYKSDFCRGEKLNLIADEPILEQGTQKDELLDIFASPKISSKEVPIGFATKAHSHIAGALQIVDLLTGLSLANACEKIAPKFYKMGSQASILRDYAVELGLEIDPVFSGRPTEPIKVNNWFHIPKKRSFS